MARVPFTLRIDSAERAALDQLSKIEGRPVNQILNDAVKIYLLKQGPREQALETSLADLRDYRKRDPEFRKAVAAFVEAEATLQDPVEGKPIVGHFVNGRFVAGKPQPAGPVQAKVRELLGD
jgi:predicted transcriptional regulator